MKIYLMTLHEYIPFESETDITLKAYSSKDKGVEKATLINEAMKLFDESSTKIFEEFDENMRKSKSSQSIRTETYATQVLPKVAELQEEFFAYIGDEFRSFFDSVFLYAEFKDRQILLEEVELEN
jgi:hypothetical protein